MIMIESMVTAALELADKGFAVFPCRETDQGGCRAKSPYTAHGHLEATTDRDRIRAWWRRWPRAMIGARVPETLLVLDIDPHNGGSYDQLSEALGALPPTVTVWSGRGDGGRHLYFRRPAGQLVRTRLPHGVDLKLSTGYCIVPPSLHPVTGEPYRWEADRGFACLPPSAVCVLTYVPRKIKIVPHPDAPVDHLVAVLDRYPEHGINNALFWAACAAAADGLLSDQLRDRLIERAVQYGESPRQAVRTVESAVKKVSR